MEEKKLLFLGLRLCFIKVLLLNFLIGNFLGNERVMINL